MGYQIQPQQGGFEEAEKRVIIMLHVKSFYRYSLSIEYQHFINLRSQNKKENIRK